MKLFTNSDFYIGPLISDTLIGNAETKLGYRLPLSYIQVLREKNGGIPRSRCFRTLKPTSWAPDHIEISAILGLGGEWGIDSDGGLGSADMIAEWGYPNVGVVICQMPSGGHDAVLLDYFNCTQKDEPGVIYVDEDRSTIRLADSFLQFRSGLFRCKKTNRRLRGDTT